jgi:alkylated DNA repair dioxygenase AlkB
MSNESIATIAQSPLFEVASECLPPGLIYEAGFLTKEEEAHWLSKVQGLPMEAMRYKQYTAKRRVISFGGRYDFDHNKLEPTSELPEAFKPLRSRAAAWLKRDPEALVHMLVAEYRADTPLGWHRDVPNFEDIVGISLMGEATLRMRPYPPVAPKKSAVINMVLAPRSIYCLSGAARWDWQHSVAATPALRYSITFRTARKS